MTGRARATTPVPVATVGTFDVANYGDVLFPEITAHELGRRLGPVELRRYSYRAMSSPPWCYAVQPIDRLRAEISGQRLLVVGGGHLVRFDKAVAPGYEPTAGDVHHPTGYWLVPTLLAAGAGVPTAWNAVGASPGTPGWAKPLLAGAMEAADYVAVRDAVSLAELHDVAPQLPIHRVPDPAFGVRVVLEARGADWAEGVRRAHGLDRPYVVFQPSTRLAAAAEATIADAVRAVRAAGRVAVVLPISPALGDRPAVIGLDEASVIDPWPLPLEIAALIAGADAVVAHSLHLTITALAHGVPALRLGAAAGTKYEQLGRFAGVRRFGPEPGELAELLAAARPGVVAPDVLESLSQLEAHWDRVGALATTDDPAARARRQSVVSVLLERLPTVLEGADVRRVDTQGQRDRAVARVADLELELDVTRRRAAELDAAVERSNQDLEHARQRADRAEADRAEADRRAAGTLRLLQEEISLRDAKLIEANTSVKRLNRDLAKVSRELEVLRRRRSVRAAVRVATVVRRVRQAVRMSHPPDPVVAPGAARQPAAPRQPASADEERALVGQLRSELPAEPRVSGPLVSVIVLTRNGRHHLERVLPALERTTYRAFEVIVVDNASSDGTAEYLTKLNPNYPLQVLTNDTNRSFSEANNQGAAVANGSLLLLLNNDTEPITPDWLGRLVTTLERTDAAAVGPRLIYPRRPGLRTRGDRTHPDLTLQHRGIGFTAADGVPLARNLGSGESPLSEAAAATREAAGLTAACVLLDRRAWDAVGGLTEGYLFGTEDVDLGLKLRAAGKRLVYDGGAALWHHEYGTQSAEAAEWKRENRKTNRQLFVDRWGPQLFREVMADRVRGDGLWSESPLHVGITVTRDDPAAGWGDLYTARELGAACETLGWKVSYLERHGERWYDDDSDIDVLVALLDSIDIRRLPRHVITVAWIRNWTHRWLSHPWFDDYDIVFASSETSRRLIDAQSSHFAQLMPLATNPERFVRTSPVSALAADVVFVGNHWGEHRGVLDTLAERSPGTTLKVFGKGWESTALAAHHQGAIEYDRVPEVYSSARIVIDDTARPTKPYGAVNGRVFDALACGALVVSDNEEGIRELFDESFPVARDASELARVVGELLADPDGAAQLASRYRDEVLARHTYAHRAAQLRDGLLAWVASRRVSILIGAPNHAEAPAWGDYHFAHSLQRQLAERGMPTRIEILPDWERASTARQDAVIHLFGLREYRTRPSQVNLLWVISHPDLVRPAACERYDVAFVASDLFAAELEPQVTIPVVPLHQATDADRFSPGGTAPEHDLLYVANSRKTRRKIIDDLGQPGVELAIYGRNWTPELVAMEHVKGDHIPNDILHRYYASAKIVLNDHWEDMRAKGFIANRIYDALASGGFVISDDVMGMDAEFDGGVVTYRTADDLHDRIRYFLEHPDERREIADRGRAAVLARHTFAHRAGVIRGTMDELEVLYPRDMADLDRWSAWIGRRARRTAVRPDRAGTLAPPPV